MSYIRIHQMFLREVLATAGRAQGALHLLGAAVGHQPVGGWQPALGGRQREQRRAQHEPRHWRLAGKLEHQSSHDAEVLQMQ